MVKGRSLGSALKICWLAVCAPPAQSLQTAVAQTQAAWTPTPKQHILPRLRHRLLQLRRACYHLLQLQQSPPPAARLGQASWRLMIPTGCPWKHLGHYWRPAREKSGWELCMGPVSNMTDRLVPSGEAFQFPLVKWQWTSTYCSSRSDLKVTISGLWEAALPRQAAQ